MAGSRFAAVFACRRQVVGLADDDTWRAFLLTTVGKDSLRAMTGREVGKVIDALHARGAKKGPKKAPRRAKARTIADKPEELSKIRALWLSLYNLAVVEDPSEAAILAFARRQRVKVDALAWMGSDDADRVIKALRGWCERIGFAQPTAPTVERFNKARLIAGLEPRNDGHAAKVLVIHAQWKALAKAGAFKWGIHASLGAWLAPRQQVADPVYLEPEAADAVIEELGAWLRRVTVETKEASGG